MATLEELLKQQEEIAKQVEEARSAGRADALEKVKADIKNYGFSAAELKSVLGDSKKAGTGKQRTVYPPELKEKALKLVKEGKSNSEIAKLLDIESATVARWKAKK